MTTTIKVHPMHFLLHASAATPLALQSYIDVKYTKNLFKCLQNAAFHVYIFWGQHAKFMQHQMQDLQYIFMLGIYRRSISYISTVITFSSARD